MTTPSPELVSLIVRLGDALGAATRPVTLESELRRSVSHLRSFFSAAACSCALVEEDGAGLRFIAADGASAHLIVGMTLPIGRGIAGWVAMSGEPMAVSNVSTDSRFAIDVAEYTGYVPDVILAAPLLDGEGETVGVIEILDPQNRGDHIGDDLSMLGLFASQLAATIRLAQKYDSIGTELLRLMADPDRTGAVDVALNELKPEATGTALHDLADAFRAIAEGGPAAATLAASILRDVGVYTRDRR